MNNFFHTVRGPETTFKDSINYKTWLSVIWKLNCYIESCVRSDQTSHTIKRAESRTDFLEIRVSVIEVLVDEKK